MDRFNYINRVFIAPIILTIWGIFLLVVPPFWDDNTYLNNTTEVSGTLDSFHTYKWGRGKSDYWVILKLNEFSNEFQDSYLNEELCDEYLKNGSPKLTFRIDNKDTNALNGQRRIGTLGTTIDNIVLQTAEQDLTKDTVIKNIFLPIMGIVLLILAYHSNRNGVKYWKYEDQ